MANYSSSESRTLTVIKSKGRNRWARRSPRREQGSKVRQDAGTLSKGGSAKGARLSLADQPLGEESFDLADHTRCVLAGSAPER